MESPSIKEQRIRKITHVYYSRPEVQKAMLEFSQNREISPRYFEGFGKRPDSLQYESDIFELVKRGATSFHASEELWTNPLMIKTGMSEKDLNKLRIGWDLLIDIDSPYFEYSRIFAKLIIEFLDFSGVKNIGIKFSGSKGFHLILPWKAFPKEINGVKTSDMFPEWPRILVKYILEKTKPKLISEITKLSTPNKYIKDYQESEKVIPDLVLVAPRHLFRMPYSLHEKTSLASVVLEKNEITKFDLKDADPLKVKIKNFIPDCKEGEASQLLMQALDWNKENSTKEETKKNFEYKPVKISDFSEKNLPPSIKKILEGVKDGRKRALFVLINFFRSIGMEREELEKKVYDWNTKNPEQLHTGYIKAQLLWSYRNKIIPPPNYDKDYYNGMGISPTEEELRLKNPVSYVARKSFQQNAKTPKNKDNFKNNN